MRDEGIGVHDETQRMSERKGGRECQDQLEECFSERDQEGIAIVLTVDIESHMRQECPAQAEPVRDVIEQ